VLALSAMVVASCRTSMSFAVVLKVSPHCHGGYSFNHFGSTPQCP
jgi:hypothetical protein